MPKRSRNNEVDGRTSTSSAESGGRRENSDSAAKTNGKGRLKYKDTYGSKATLKRQRTSALPALTLEGSLSEEILLRCLSFLSAHDLAGVSRVSSAWHRLAQDSQLWRALYLCTFASATTRRQTQLSASNSHSRPWRELYKISANWRSGNARTSTLGRGIRRAVLPAAPPDVVLEPTRRPAERLAAESSAYSATEGETDTLVQIYHNYIFTASRSPSSTSTIPEVAVQQSLPSGGSISLGTVSSSRLINYFSTRPDFRPPLSITELRLDDSSSSSSSPILAVFYSTGQFSLFRLTLPASTSPSLPLSAQEVYTSLALGSPLSYAFASRFSAPFDPICLARLNGELLVTCSEAMVVRFWHIRETGDGNFDLEEGETPLQASEKSWRPVVLSLEKIEEAEDEQEECWNGGRGMVSEGRVRYRASLAYSTPIFPASWTVGLQEFIASLPSPSSASTFSRRRLTISSRSAIAQPIHTPLPSTPRRTSAFSPSSPVSTRTPRTPVTSIEHSHPFIVTSRRDNQLDVYEVVYPPSSASTVPARPEAFSTPSRIRPSLSTSCPPPLPPLKLEHRRTLFGHTARVAGVALLEGVDRDGAVRCVSAGDDGKVKVWELRPSSPNASSSSSDAAEARVREMGKRRRIEEVVDVSALAMPSYEGREEKGETAWQRMKRRRNNGSRGKERDEGSAGERPEKVKRVLVREDKIVLVGAGGREGESVRVLRFD